MNPVVGHYRVSDLDLAPLRGDILRFRWNLDRNRAAVRCDAHNRAADVRPLVRRRTVKYDALDLISLDPSLDLITFGRLCAVERDPVVDDLCGIAQPHFTVRRRFIFRRRLPLDDQSLSVRSYGHD